jgi:hypothetical protein
MLAININDNGTVQAAINALTDLQRRQLPFASARAITKTAIQAKAELREEMARVFDRPTPFALNSLRIQSATKTRLEARVWLKDEWSVGSKGTPATKYLAPEIFGGGRGQKSMERALHQAGILPSGMVCVPAINAELDAYGNLPPGQIVQMLSSLGVMQDIWARQTRRSMRRHRTPSEFFVMTQRNHVPFGIYRRKGSVVKPFIHFVKAPRYQPRFEFFDVAQKVVDRDLARNFNESMRQALETAR